MAKNNAFVREITTKAGSKLLKIEIRKFGQTFRKNVKISDFDNKAQAMEFARSLRDEALVKMRKGYTVSKFPTVEALYKESFELFPLRKKTVQRHDLVYKNLLAQYGDITIDKITLADIQQSLNKYAKTHSKEDTKRVVSIWKRIYKVCAYREINIVDKTALLDDKSFPDCREAKHRKKDISLEDLEKFLDTLWNYSGRYMTSSYRAHAVYYGIRIMQYCGLRPAETFALLKSDIDLARGVITVDKASRSTKDSRLDIDKTKTRTSIRNVPIPSALRPILVECLQWSRNDILLSDYYGNLLDIDDIDTLVLNVRKKAGVNFTLYQLRHQFSTDLLSNGAPLNAVRDLMGHSNVAMTLSYATSSEKDRKEVISQRKFS